MGTIEAARATRNSVDLAQEALQLSKDQFRIEERPWMLPNAVLRMTDKYPVMTEFGDDNKATGRMWFNVRIEVQNAGKTPAIEVHFSPPDYLKGPMGTVLAQARQFVPKYSRGPGTFIGPS
ncbi:MAG TPA: hypothetical protein VI386_29530 [Candidatus Sulfotelmatobacter sp.]